MKEFRVNNYITLKLEDGKTNIYVDGELFEQCKFLLLNIPVEKVSSLDEIESVDEAAENLSKKMERNEASEFKISPEVEFWAHCSNLQVWSEYNYDTRLIHSNLAFPLLKKLTEVGDPIAKRVFKEEIAKRLESGYWPVIEFLMKEEYTDYLSREELFNSVLGNDNPSQKEVEFLIEIENISNDKFKIETKVSQEWNSIVIENNRVIKINIVNTDTLPDSIDNLKNLKELYLVSNELKTIPDSIGNLNNLEKLYLTDNEIKTLPKSIENLKSLKILDLTHNNIQNFPKSILKLKLLKVLNLGKNRIKTIPNEIEFINELKEFRLDKNNLSDLPLSMKNLNSLTYLNLMGNEFVKLPEVVGKIQSLELLNLSYNILRELPNSLLQLKNLKKIILKKNPLDMNQEVIQNLKKKKVEVLF